MKNFTCSCGNTLYFANYQCLSCQRLIGYLPQEQELSAFEPQSNGRWQACLNGKTYRLCANHTHYNVCNWMVEDGADSELCVSCQLTAAIPDLSKPNNLTLWFRMEQAKRRLLYTLTKLRLPVWHPPEGKPALTFQFLEDVTEDEFGQELTIKEIVMTGHAHGVITLNLQEAQDAARTEMREKMNERYRTLVGHLRHESGHYYWECLINDSPLLERFRVLFGDERQDYTDSLQAYYQNGPVSDWQNSYISAYASAHPWEDWAETWAHYLHMLDTLETAKDYTVTIKDIAVSQPFAASEQAHERIQFSQVFEDWVRLTRVLNALNRSMGLDDAYPFVIPDPALNKLSFVHDLLHHHL